MFSNVHRVLSQCNARLRFLYLITIISIAVTVHIIIYHYISCPWHVTLYISCPSLLLSGTLFVPKILQIKKACKNLFRISHLESMEWEMNLITMKQLVFGCRAKIACLQKLADTLESGARTCMNRIYAVHTGLIVIGGKCF